MIQPHSLDNLLPKSKNENILNPCSKLSLSKIASAPTRIRNDLGSYRKENGLMVIKPKSFGPEPNMINNIPQYKHDSPLGYALRGENEPPTINLKNNQNSMRKRHPFHRDDKFYDIIFNYSSLRLSIFRIDKGKIITSVVEHNMSLQMPAAELMNSIIIGKFSDATILIDDSISIHELKFNPGPIGIQVEFIDNVLTCTDIIEDSQAFHNFKNELLHSEILCVNEYRVTSLDSFTKAVASFSHRGVSLTVLKRQPKTDNKNKLNQFIAASPTKNDIMGLLSKLMEKQQAYFSDDMTSDPSVAKQSSLFSVQSLTRLSTEEDSLLAPKVSAVRELVGKSFYGNSEIEEHEESHAPSWDFPTSVDIPHAPEPYFKLICKPFVDILRIEEKSDRNCRFMVSNLSKGNLVSLYHVDNDRKLSARKTLRVGSVNETGCIGSVWAITVCMSNEDENISDRDSAQDLKQTNVLFVCVNEPRLVKQKNGIHQLRREYIWNTKENSVSVSNYVSLVSKDRILPQFMIRVVG